MFIRQLTYVAFVFLMASTAAQAENWVQISKTEHSTVYVDRDSGERSQGHVKFWLKYVFDAPHPIGVYDGRAMTGPNVKGTTKFVEMRSQLDVDCPANTVTNPFVKFYDATETMVSSAIGPMESRDLPPNSIGKAGAELMCPTR